MLQPQDFSMVLPMRQLAAISASKRIMAQVATLITVGKFVTKIVIEINDHI